jgi:hypothetical protein
MRTYKFQSLTAFYAATERSTEHRPSSWIGATPEEIEARRYSWPEAVKQLDQLPELHQQHAHTKRAKRWTETDGDDMSPERYADSRPFMRQRYRAATAAKTGGRVQKIRINVAESESVSAAAMLWKTYAAARLVDQLESNGTRTEILIVCSTRRAFTRGDADYLLEITIKRPEQPLNVAAIATAASPWMLRRHILDHNTTQTDATGTGGSPRAMPTDPAALDIETGDCLSKAAAEAWIKNQTI